jgi:hypothetical protein
VKQSGFRAQESIADHEFAMPGENSPENIKAMTRSPTLKIAKATVVKWERRNNVQVPYEMAEAPFMSCLIFRIWGT